METILLEAEEEQEAGPIQIIEVLVMDLMFMVMMTTRPVALDIDGGITALEEVVDSGQA